MKKENSLTLLVGFFGGLVLAAVLATPARAAVSQECDEGSACGTCHCVGYCSCLINLYSEPCREQLPGEDPCWVIRRNEIDGGEENCQYICCRHEEWDCEQ